MNDAAKPPLTTTTSIWPAAAVVGIGLVTLVVFMLINLVANPTVTTPTTVPIVVGGLATAKSNAAVAGCQQPGTPPSNISGALFVPVGTKPVSATVHANGGAGDYDCYRDLVTSTSAGSLLGYYRTHLEALGWNLFSSGATSGQPQLLFQKAGSDTFYWVVGITVQRSTRRVIHWSYRIYQNSSTL